MRDVTIINYVETYDGGHNGDFPNATIAEKKISESGASWIFLDFSAGIGRTNYGFYDEVGVPESPSVPFSPPIVDFSDNLTFQSYFSGTTNFTVISSSVEMDVEYEFSGFADAFGTVILPNELGERECVQINYEEHYTFLWMGTPVQHSYLRSYYYLAEDLGIVAIITSLEDDAPAPNDFNVANTIARMFESSKYTEPEGQLGDVNNDGALNVLDIVLMVNIILVQHDPSDYELWAADINGDGAINVMDIVQLVGLIMCYIPHNNSLCLIDKEVLNYYRRLLNKQGGKQ